MNAAVKGYFNDPRANPLSQKCFGDWMDPKVDQISTYLDDVSNRGVFAIMNKDAL